VREPSSYMTAPADPPGVDAVRAPPKQGRRHPAVRWIVHGVLLVALTVGIFGLLPHLGGLTRDAAGLRHARPAYLVAAVAAEAVSLGCYAQLYRRVLAALGARIRLRLAADVIMATFFVSHLTPFGSATGTLVNASTLESEGIAATTTGEAIALSSLTSTVALIALFGSGFAATAGQHVSRQYLVIAGVALFLVVTVLAAVLAVGARPAIAGRAGRWVASVARHVRGDAPAGPVRAGEHVHIGDVVRRVVEHPRAGKVISHGALSGSAAQFGKRLRVRAELTDLDAGRDLRESVDQGVQAEQQGQGDRADAWPGE
jgi:Lysylphosphatidylglycerol synthase TM region